MDPFRAFSYKVVLGRHGIHLSSEVWSRIALWIGKPGI